MRGEQTVRNLIHHLETLTVLIGERSVRYPHKLQEAGSYIEEFYRSLSLPVELESYQYRNFTTANVIAEARFSDRPSKRYLVGAHYDSVAGTVGADDNASAVAVQLEVARRLASMVGSVDLDLAVKFVSFTLEEPPAFLTRYRGSRVHARSARKAGEQIDGMICLEMVGYTCDRPGCQKYPLPIMLLKYPRIGSFIGIVGDWQSISLAQSLYLAFQRNPDLPVLRQIVPLRGWLLPSVRRSDHASFWDLGYKAVMITDTAFFRNPHYHRASDTMETLDYSFMAELVESLLIFFLSHGRHDGGASLARVLKAK